MSPKVANSLACKSSLQWITSTCHSSTESDTKGLNQTSLENTSKSFGFAID